MKRLILIALAAIAMVACEKSGDLPAGVSSVTLDQTAAEAYGIFVK